MEAWKMVVAVDHGLVEAEEVVGCSNSLPVVVEEAAATT